MSVIDDANPQFEKALEHLQKELSGIRTGRATPALVEDIEVEAYGAIQPLKALSSISTPDARTIQIEPWDKSVLKDIESAIQKSDIGVNPSVDSDVVRLNMPMMTDENRQKMAKTIKEKLENARISVRQTREDVKKKIDGMEDTSEDEQRALFKDLDKRVKEYNEKIENIGKKKIEEITTL